MRVEAEARRRLLTGAAVSSKKVSDLYCYRHDSEACGCREHLALPNVGVTIVFDNLVLDAVRSDVFAVIPILGFAWSAFALSFPFPIGDASEMCTAHGVLLYVNDSANHDPGDENPRDYSVT